MRLATDPVSSRPHGTGVSGGGATLRCVPRRVGGRASVRVAGFSHSSIHGLLSSRPMPPAPATSTHPAALARLGHALSDPPRVGVLLPLREAPAYPSDLADALG